MKNVILLAPPCAGKGTISKMLVDSYGYEQLSAGDLLREKAKTDEVVRNILASGALVEDSLIFGMLREKIESLGNKPFILDGFPRTVKQADMYKDLLSELNMENPVVIYLDVPYDELVKRSTSRLVCGNCGSSYSTINDKLKPKAEGICDRCGSALSVRDDDTEEVFKSRYDLYINSTSKLINYYEDLGLLVHMSSTELSSLFKEVSLVLGGNND